MPIDASKVVWDAPEPIDTSKVQWDESTTQATPAPAPIERPSSFLRRAVGDTAVDLGKGVVGVGEAAVGLGNLVSGGYVGKGLEAIGYDPQTTKKMLEEGYTHERVAANKAVSDAKGFVGTTKALIQNPSALIGTAVESAPLMLGGGAVARGGAALLGRAGSIATPGIRGAAAAIPQTAAGRIGLAAAGEGLVGAGSAAEGIRQQSDDGLLSAKQTGAALASGAGTAALGALGGKVAQKIGIADVDVALAGGAKAASAKPKNILRRTVEGMVSEGLLEELPQSMQEQMWQNVALDKPLMEGVPEAAAAGALAGGLMGGGFSAISRPDVRPSQNVGTSEPSTDTSEQDPFAGYSTQTDTSEPLSGVAAPLSGDIPIQPQTPAAQMAANMRMEAQIQRANAKTVLGRAAADATEMQADAVAADPFDLSDIGAIPNDEAPVDGFTRLGVIAQDMGLDPEAIVSAARADVGDDPQYSLDGLDDRILTIYAQSLAPTVRPAQAQDGFPSEGAGGSQPAPVQAPSVEAQSGQANPVEGGGLAGESPVVAGDEPALASVPAAGAQAQEVSTASNAYPQEGAETRAIAAPEQPEYDESEDILDSDITTPSGTPFTIRDAADRAAARHEGGRVFPVDGGFVVRVPSPQASSSGQSEAPQPVPESREQGALAGQAQAAPAPAALPVQEDRAQDAQAVPGSGLAAAQAADSSPPTQAAPAPDSPQARQAAREANAPADLLAKRDAATERLNAASAAMQQFPAGNMGLTPDAVKATPEWKAAKIELDRATVVARNANAAVVKASKAKPAKAAPPAASDGIDEAAVRAAYNAAMQAKTGVTDFDYGKGTFGDLIVGALKRDPEVVESARSSLINGSNETGLRVFFQQAGMKMPRTQREQRAAFDAYIGVTPEQRAASDKAKADSKASQAADKAMKSARSGAASVSMHSPDGQSVDGATWVDGLVAEGYSIIVQRGASTYLAKRDGSGYKMPHKAIAAYARLAAKSATEAKPETTTAEQPTATHADPGEAPEAVTPAVIAEAAKTADRAPTVSMAEARKVLLAKLDAAIKAAPANGVLDDPPTTAKKRNGRRTWDVDIGRKVEGLAVPAMTIVESHNGTTYSIGRVNTRDVLATEHGLLAARLTAARLQQGAEWAANGKNGGWTFTPVAPVENITLDVPGDGTFKVRNTKERLTAFRKQVESFFKLPKHETPKPESLTVSQAARDKIMAEAETVDDAAPESEAATPGQADRAQGIDTKQQAGRKPTRAARFQKTDEIKDALRAHARAGTLESEAAVPLMAEAERRLGEAGMDSLNAELDRLEEGLSAEPPEAPIQSERDAMAAKPAPSQQQAGADAFVASPGGGLDFGEITPEQAKALGRQPGKIRLREGDSATGRVHIEERHGDQIRGLGFAGVEAFVFDIANRFTAIYKHGDTRGLDVVLNDDKRGMLIVQLEPAADGDYYDVKTATPIRSDQFKNKKPLWMRAGPSAPPAKAGPLNPRGQSGQADDTTADKAPREPIPSTGRGEGKKEAKPDPADTKPNTEDAGEELWANRRNSTGKGLQWADIEAMNPTLKAREAVKSKVWPRPNYEQLVEGGIPAPMARIIKSVYDAIATKPQTSKAPTDADYQAYIAGVQKVRDAAFAWARAAMEKAPAADNKDVVEFGEKHGLAAKDVAALVGVMLKRGGDGSMLDTVFPYDAQTERNRFRAGTPRTNANNDLALLLGGRKLTGAMQVIPQDIMAAIRDVQKGWPSPQEAWEKSYTIHEDKVGDRKFRNGQTVTITEPSFWIASKQGRFNLIVAEGFKTREDAAAAAKALYEKKRKKGGDGAKSEAPVDLKDTREGPQRRQSNEDITSDKLRDTFGFKGVNFGNWMKGASKAKIAERQAHLNNAYDSMLDLAEILGVPPRAMSLNGMLGLAIGAQGSGGRGAAHFVPGVNEINLTRGQGAGSLAHEWAHALDHYFATLAGGRVATGRTPFLSEHTADKHDGVRPEVQEAFKAIVKAMRGRDMTTEEVAAQERAMLESAKRSLERSLAFMRDGLAKNTLKSGRQREEVLASFDELASRLRNGDVGEGYLKHGKGFNDSEPQVVAMLAMLYRESLGYKYQEIPALGYNARRVAESGKAKQSNATHIPQVPSNFRREALKLDKGSAGKYWSSTLEMFARSFQSYVLDRLAAQGARNDYLTRPQMDEAAIKVAQEMGIGEDGDRYPRGDERNAINRGFDTLVASLRTRETDDGNVALENVEDSATEWLSYMEADESRTGGDFDADRLGLRKAVNALLGKSGLRVEYLRGYAGLPDNLRNAVESRNAMGRKGQTAALYDPVTQRVFVFTHVVRTPERAAWNAAHEIAGHDGLRKLLGKRLDEVLELADKNPTVAALADEIAVQRKLTPAQRLLAVEEALAELAAAVRTGDYGRIQEKYRIEVPEGIRARVAQAVANFIRRLKELLQNRTGVVFKDADVRALLENAWQAAQSDAIGTPSSALESTEGGSLEGMESNERLDDEARDPANPLPYIRQVWDDYNGATDSIMSFTDLVTEVQRIVEDSNDDAPGVLALREAADNYFDELAEDADKWGGRGDFSDWEAAFERAIVAALGNPTSDSILESVESVGDALASAGNSIRNVKLPAGYLLSDLFGSQDGVKSLHWWDTTVGTQFNLAKKSHLFRRVFDSVQNMVADISHYANAAMDRAPDILPKFDSIKDAFKKRPMSAADAKKVSDAVFQGTKDYTRDVNGDAVKTANVSEAGIVWTREELASLFGMNAKQIGLYEQARAAIDRSLDDTAVTQMIRHAGEDGNAVRDEMLAAGNAQAAANILSRHLADQIKLMQGDTRSKSLQETADQVQEIAKQIDKLKAKGYAPLSRFGRYTVYRDGNNPLFLMFETQREANRAARMLREKAEGNGIKTGVMSQEQFKLFKGMTPETLELFGEMLGLDKTGNEQDDLVFQSFLKAAKSNRSALKRLIHRQGVEGYSQDLPRVLAAFLYSNARLAATNLHAPETQRAINDIPKEQGDLQDAAIKLNEYIVNPDDAGAFLSSFNFAQYLGGSIASAMVNMTQPLTMSFPWLSQYGGAWEAAKALGGAMKLVGKGGDTGNAMLDEALKRADADGHTQPQEVHQLQSYASGNGVLRAGDGTKAGDAMAKAFNAKARVVLAWGIPFSLAEQFNRRTTFIAAFNMATEQGMSDPYGFAVNAVQTTQGIYNKANRPAWSRNAIGGMAFTFKTYSINYVEMLYRMWTQGGKEGKKGVLLAMGVMFLLSGAGGLPGSDDLDDLIDGVMQRMGYNFSSKQEREEFFASILGEQGAKFMEHGLSAVPGMPIDVSGRLGMGNLIPSTGLLVRKADHSRDIAEIAGPTGDFIKRSGEAFGQLVEGNLGASMLAIAPRAAANAWKGIEMAETGEYRDTRGRKVLETTGLEAASKFIGFQPASVAKVQQASGAVMDLMSNYRIVSASIADRWAKGIYEQDPGEVLLAQKELADWNAKNPDMPIRIGRNALRSRVRNLAMDRRERLSKSTPKAVRAQVETMFDARTGRNRSPVEDTE